LSETAVHIGLFSRCAFVFRSQIFGLFRARSVYTSRTLHNQQPDHLNLFNMTNIW